VKHILLHTLLILVFNLLIANLTFGYGHKTVAEEGQTDDSDTMESLGDLNEKNSSSSSDSTLQKRGDSNLNTNQKIRFRSLSGRYTSDIQESSSSTSSIIWNGLGIGQSVYKYKTIDSGDTYDLENKLIEISYTFGDEFTLTLGVRTVTSGNLTITSSDNEILHSSNVEGYGYFSVLGIELGIFEILAGFQHSSYVFSEIENASNSSYVPKYVGSGGLYVTGIGIAF
jgi:hypothetical protein